MKRKVGIFCIIVGFMVNLSGTGRAEPVLPTVIDQLIKVAANRQNPEKFHSFLDVVVATYPSLAEAIREKAESYRAAWVARIQNSKRQHIRDTDSPLDIPGVDGEMDISLYRATGNTRQKTLSVGGKAMTELGDFINSLEGYYSLNKSENDPSRQQWGLLYKLDYELSDKFYLTGSAGYENDTDGAFRERISLSSGAGLRLLEKENLSWDFEGGPGILWTQRDEGLDFESEFTGLLRNEIKYSFADHSSLSNQTEIYLSSNRIITNSSVLKVKINGALSSKFSYDITYEEDAVEESESTERIARAGLLVDF